MLYFQFHINLASIPLTTRLLQKKILLCKLQEISAETDHQFPNGRSTLLKYIKRLDFNTKQQIISKL